MYEDMLKKMMSDEVTFEDWKEYRTWFENRPPIIMPEKYLAGGERPTQEEIKADAQIRADFVNVAHHVASTLHEEDIFQDLILFLAYEENQHPEHFASTSSSLFKFQ